MEFNHLFPEGSWLNEWLRSTEGLEAPRSYILGAGLATLGAVLGRNVHLTINSLLGPIYPMCSVLFLGPSGSGKGVALGQAYRLLRSLPEPPNIVTSAITMEALHDEFVQSPGTVVLEEELTTLFGKQDYLSGMLPYILELLDCRDRVERRTRGKKLVAQCPEPTFLLGSTIELVRDYLPESANAGGFFARFVVLTERQRYRRNPYADVGLSPKQAQKLQLAQQTLVARLVDYLGASGPLHLNWHAIDRYNYWEACAKSPSVTLDPIFARSRVHIHRLAMLIAISRGSLEINAQDMSAALEIWQYVLGSLAPVLSPVTKVSQLREAILHQFDRRGPMSLQALKRTPLKNYYAVAEIVKGAGDLVQTGDLVEHPGQLLSKAIQEEAA